jgi:UDP-glucose-4-epimerase GalE
MSAPRVLVTGGAGYIGSHAAKALKRAGFEPVVYDDLSRGHRELVRFGPLEIGSILDGQRLREVVERHQPVGIVHFAAFAYVEESMRAPSLYFANNVGGSAVLIHEAVRAGRLPIVFSSTCAVYGNAAQIPVDESAPIAPVSPYGESKALVETLLQRAATHEGLTSIALRYFNAAGADPDAEIGEWHEPEPHLIPRVLDAAGDPTQSITVNGLDWPTADGSCIRDYIHVVDLADAHVRALRYLLDGGASTACNLSAGVGSSVLEIIRATERVSGRTIRVEIGPRRDGDPARVIGNPALATRLLSWTAQRSDVDTIVADAWRWHRRGAR